MAFSSVSLPLFMTTVLSVRCQQCGAPLQISEGLRFVTCTYCHAELEVVRDASTIHTEVLAKLEAKTDAMAGSLKVIEIQNEIERLDREWAMWREKFLPRDREGVIEEPGPPEESWIVLAKCFSISIALAVFAYALSWPAVGYLFVPIAFAIALWVGKGQNAMAHAYDQAFTRYQSDRSGLLHQLAVAMAQG